MAAKRVAFALCTLGFLQTSFAGFDRFGFFPKMQTPKCLKHGNRCLKKNSVR